MDTQNMNSKGIFTRHEYYDHLIKTGKTKSKHSYDYALRKDVSSGKVFHLGRDKYISCDSKPIYSYSYSEEAHNIAEIITTEFYDLNFRIFEVTQLNSFVNHLYSHNTIFLSVENDIIDYVFDSLKSHYPGKVLLKPKADEYFRYLVDDLIVINRLPSESPKGTELFWHSRLEKILVDITSVPDLGGAPEQIDITTLSDTKQRNMNGLFMKLRYSFCIGYCPLAISI